jgi:hypothetical protein
VDSARELAQLVESVLQSLGNATQLRRKVIELGGNCGSRGTELERERDEPLLRPVMEVALDPPPRLVGACHDARARRA